MKRVLITGGTSGIGLAAAECFLQEGAAVALVGRDKKRGLKAVEYLHSRVPGGTICFFPGDVSKVSACHELAKMAVRAMGGIDVLWREVLAWMHKVEKSTHTIPVLYISQNFVNKYLRQRPDIKRKYHVWIARYGEYKPDVRLAYWQLCSDGRVEGIHGDVDINVFNGYGDQFEEFIQKESIQ